MANSVWLGARVVLVAGALIASGIAAQARGALVIGECGAWGGSWDYGNDRSAQSRALEECRDRNCQIVTTFSDACTTFAYDTGQSCGAWGWATRTTRRQARTAAIEHCQGAGEQKCEVRGQICDGD